MKIVLNNSLPTSLLAHKDLELKSEVDDMFKDFDADKSGTLNLEEAIKAGDEDKAEFRLADTDNNGEISKDELLEFAKKIESESEHESIDLQQLVSALAKADSSLIDQLLTSEKNGDEETFNTLLDQLLANAPSNEASSGQLVDTNA